MSDKRGALLRMIGSLGRCVVALSGGVDSAVVAQAAHLALGDKASAITGNSPSLATGELDAARAVAAHIGMRHTVIDTQEFANPAYARNDGQRCYHCKTELYTRMTALAEQAGDAVLLNGANADDAADYRPGMLAALEHRVRSPLLECGITKAEVRQLAADWELPVWDKPASPCLSSRVAYGEEVTPERVQMIDEAEQFLRSHGFRTLRVRYHPGNLARIEVPPEELANLVEAGFRDSMVKRFRELGFQFVTLDLVGFRSGSLNALVTLQRNAKNSVASSQ